MGGEVPLPHEGPTADKRVTHQGDRGEPLTGNILETDSSQVRKRNRTMVPDVLGTSTVPSVLQLVGGCGGEMCITVYTANVIGACGLKEHPPVNAHVVTSRSTLCLYFAVRIFFF